MTAVVLAGLVAGSTVIACKLQDWPAKRFGVVEEGVLYRSGQPGREGWEILSNHYGIRTVVDVRQIRPEADWSIYEQEFCRKHNIRFEKMPVGPPRLYEWDLKRFFSIMNDRKNHPVLVHCEAGSIRSGVVVATYRIVAQHWSYEDALAEAQRYGFRPNSYPGYCAYLKELAGPNGWRPADKPEN